jgi:hypothetical protein
VPASRAFAGGVIGSSSPLISSVGTSLRTAWFSAPLVARSPQAAQISRIDSWNSGLKARPATARCWSRAATNSRTRAKVASSLHCH